MDRIKDILFFNLPTVISYLKKIHIHKCDYDYYNIISQKVKVKSRYCKICSKKQIKVGQEWIDWTLSKSEIRDEKLKELGI